jgi:hypothetical protein
MCIAAGSRKEDKTAGALPAAIRTKSGPMLSPPDRRLLAALRRSPADCERLK